MVIELLVGLVGLYLLVFRTEGLSTRTYLGTALVLGLLFEHGRGLWRRRKWAFAVCIAIGKLLVLGSLVAWAWFIHKMVSGSIGVGTGIFAMLQVSLILGSGRSLIENSKEAIRKEKEKASQASAAQKERAEEPALPEVVNAKLLAAVRTEAIRSRE